MKAESPGKRLFTGLKCIPKIEISVRRRQLLEMIYYSDSSLRKDNL